MFSCSIDQNKPMVKISLFSKCFAIFLDLNNFLEEVRKLFVGAGGGRNRT